MAIGLYKQGQGYWVRMLTAIGAGILFLACAAWVWQSLARISPPSVGMNVSVTGSQGTRPAEGATVEFVAGGESSPLATGTVRSVSTSGDGLVFEVRGLALTPEAERAKRDYSEARTLRTSGGWRGDIPGVGSMLSIPAFNMTYIQTAAAAVVLLIGTFVVYLLVGSRPKSVDFLINADIEARKVNWSTRKEVIGSTWVVIGAMFLIAATLFVIDLVFQGIFSAIDVLQR